VEEEKSGETKSVPSAGNRTESKKLKSNDGHCTRVRRSNKIENPLANANRIRPKQKQASTRFTQESTEELLRETKPWVVNGLRAIKQDPRRQRRKSSKEKFPARLRTEENSESNKKIDAHIPETLRSESSIHKTHQM
jgi:hypothetical protein